MNYTARDHAFVYGAIAQAAFSLYPGCAQVLVDGIKTYGLQRGARMAQTAAAHGDTLNMQHYMAYGEWAPAPGEMDVRVPETSPSAVWNVYKCPWQQEWAEQGMLDVGKLYCAYVDAELVHGFHPALELGTGATQTAGDSFCYFKWTGADMTPEHTEENNKIKEDVGAARLRPWAYHMAHIYKTLGEHMEKALGANARAAVCKAADERLTLRYGADCVVMLHAGLTVDYWVTPYGKKMETISSLFAAQ